MAGIHFQVLCMWRGKQPFYRHLPKAVVESAPYYKPYASLRVCKLRKEGSVPFWGVTLSEVLWTGKKKTTLRLNIHFSENKPLGIPSMEVAQSNQLAHQVAY